MESTPHLPLLAEESYGSSTRRLAARAARPTATEPHTTRRTGLSRGETRVRSGTPRRAGGDAAFSETLRSISTSTSRCGDGQPPCRVICLRPCKPANGERARRGCFTTRAPPPPCRGAAARPARRLIRARRVAREIALKQPSRCIDCQTFWRYPIRLIAALVRPTRTLTQGFLGSHCIAPKSVRKGSGAPSMGRVRCEPAPKTRSRVLDHAVGGAGLRSRTCQPCERLERLTAPKPP